MRYKIFGRKTGLRVSQLALGAGNFGTAWGYGAEPAEARRMYDAYIEAGGNFIDTANGYQFGQSESLVGEFIASDRDNIVLATKYTLGAAPSEGLLQTGNSRKNMIRSVEASLKRLNTDRIDLLWAHMADDATPTEEILRGFDDLVRAGKVQYVGFSNFPAWRVARADVIAELRGYAPLAGIQIEYSLVERSSDRDLLPMAAALGLAITAWSPLGGGFLTGKYRQSESDDKGRLETFGRLIHSEKSPRETAVLDALLAVASELSAPPAHIAIAWLLERSQQSGATIIPILGPRTLAQFEQTIGALEIKLSSDQIARLNDAGAVEPSGVQRQLNESAARISGGHGDLLDLPSIPVA